LSSNHSSTHAIFLGRISTHVKTPLYRNAYAWLLSTGLSSALGLIYWVLAARLYSREAVGLSAALVSTLILVAGISQLNLLTALVRFIPNAGRKTAQLTAGAYLVSALVALLTSVVFVALSSRLAGLNLFASNWKLAAMFIGATMAWTVFNLQDGVLAGLRAAVWVPVDNIAYSLAKTVLLVVLAPLSPRLGIFISWIVPTIVLLPAINLLIFRHLIPRHIQATQDSVVPLHWRELSKYVGSNYFSSLFSLTSSRLLPVLVVAVAGAAAGAYFYVAWAISDSLRIVTVQMATSLTVEGAHDARSVTVNGYAFLRLLLGLFVPLVVAVVVAAPLILRLSGSDYAVEGVALLRLLSIAVVPSLLITWYLSIARVRHQLLEILTTEGSLALLVLSLSYLLLRAHGVTGVGIAVLISVTIVALALLPRLRSALLPAQTRESHEFNTSAAAR
jgi:O-antigen/teichoic acid export membrane protein